MTKPKQKPTRITPTTVGKIWLKTGEVLDFATYPEFFQARAFYDKKRRIIRAIHSIWGSKVPVQPWGRQ